MFMEVNVVGVPYNNVGSLAKQTIKKIGMV